MPHALPTQEHLGLDLERAQPRSSQNACNLFRLFSILLIVVLEIGRGVLAYLNIRTWCLVVDFLLHLIVRPSIQVHQWSVEDRLLHVQLETLGTPSSWRELIAGAFTKRPVPTISGLPILQGQQHDLQHSEATSYRPTPTDIGTSVTAQAVEYAATSSHLLTASRHLIHRVGMHPKDEDCHIHGPGTPFINEDLSLPSVHVDIVMNTDTQKHLTCNLDLLQNPVALEDGNQAVTLVSAPIQHNGDVAHIIAVTHVAETSGLVPGPETAPNARVTSNYDKIYIPGH